MSDHGRFIEVAGADAHAFRFVTKAISDNPTRLAAMLHTYCDDNKLVATDGHRIHYVDLGDNPYGFEQGKFYRHLKNSRKSVVWFAEITVDEDFPAWKKVMPSKDECTFLMTFGDRFRSTTFAREYTSIIRKLPKENTVEIKYIKDMEGVDTYDVYFQDKNKPVLFCGKRCTAAIMVMDIGGLT